MASGKKTRFSAVVNQQSKLVFGVQAQKNGDLTIIIPSQGRIFDDGSVIQNQKYSIHRSLRSDNGAFTIKQTIDFVQKPSLTTVQYRHRSSEQWLVPIFIQRVLQLSFEKYDLKTRANDTVVNLCSFDENLNSLVYALFVSAKGVDLTGAPQAAWNYASVEFEHFTLHIFFGYLWVNALPNEDIFTSMTSLPRREDGDIPDSLKIDPQTADYRHVPYLLDELLGRICRRLIERIKVLTNGEDIPPHALPFCHTLYREPRRNF